MTYRGGAELLMRDACHEAGHYTAARLIRKIVLGVLAHLLEHALAGRTLPLVVGEPVMDLARGQLRLRRGAVSCTRRPSEGALDLPRLRSITPRRRPSQTNVHGRTLRAQPVAAT